MKASTITPSNAPPVDEDIVEQAKPGHGIPSQDPESAAQMPLAPHEAEREANSALIGGGVVAGAATGAAIGVAVAGPVGVLVGASLGAITGALGGAAAGAAGSTEDSKSANATLVKTESTKTAPSNVVRLKS